jgi:hypothetical protein
MGLGFYSSSVQYERSLDDSFENDGIAITLVNPFATEYVSAIAIQADGAIVAAGSSSSDKSGNNFTLVRYLGDPLPNRPQRWPLTAD